MSTFTYIPVYGATETTRARVLKAQFGDGYAQRVGDGINNKPRMWALSFSKTQSDIESILTFLNTEGGVTSFIWQPPRGASGSWICEEWNNSVNDGYDSLTVQFMEVFGE
jgi:phage-related protein